MPRIQKQDKLREARKLKRRKYLDEIDFPSLLEHFQVCSNSFEFVFRDSFKFSVAIAT